MQRPHARLVRSARRAAALLLAACSGSIPALFSSASAPPPSAGAHRAAVGAGQVKVALILPLSAAAMPAARRSRCATPPRWRSPNSTIPNIQLLVKDDGGTAGGAQQAAQQALAEGAEIILGPLFAQSVGAVGAVARQRGVPVIAFSTDASVAARGVYLLSFLPESDVDRVVDYAIASGKRSFAALMPDNAYGSVVQAAFQQAVARGGGRVVALERYPLDPAQMQAPAERVAQAARRSTRSSFRRGRTRCRRPCRR